MENLYYMHENPFGCTLATATDKSLIRGRNHLRAARNALWEANNRISALQADVKERHICTKRLRLRKNAEIASLLAEVARLKAENETLKEKIASLEKLCYSISDGWRRVIGCSRK